MIIPEKKRAVAIMVSRMGGKRPVEAKPEESFGGAGPREDYKAVAEDVLRAIEEKSIDGLASAFEALMQMDESEDESEG